MDVTHFTLQGCPPGYPHSASQVPKHGRWSVNVISLFLLLTHFLFLSFTPTPTQFLLVGMRKKQQGYGLQWKYTTQIHILSSPGKLCNYHPSKWKQTSHLLKTKQCASRKVLCNFFKSFAAYHLQKSHFEIFDVSLKYSGSHFSAAAYFKNDRFERSCFSFVPFELPQGDSTTINIFF